MTSRANLQAAHEEREDEFYTLYDDVADEMDRIPAEWWNVRLQLTKNLPKSTIF